MFNIGRLGVGAHDGEGLQSLLDATDIDLLDGKVLLDGRDVSAELRGRLLRRGTGRDHGYPGGHLRPPAFDRERGRGRLARHPEQQGEW